jgi:hypothetical protein
MSSTFPPYPPPGGPPVGPPNPFAQPQGSPAPTPAKLSLLALTSLSTALLAPLLSCLCIPTILLGLISVGTGILSLYKINTSDGRLKGLPLAVVGLALSVPVLLLSLFMAPGFFSGLAAARVKPMSDSPQADALRAAELKILSDSEGVAHGNSPEAQVLAERYAETMKELREVLFTPDKKKAISLTEGNFITYCQLSRGKCALVVHVPGYKNFTSDAKKSLAELAWRAAQQTVRDTLQEGDQLAVGLKGTLLYGSVMVGTVVADDSPSDGIAEESIDKEKLHPFFESETTDAPIVPESDLPEDAATPAEEK